uniref:Uncharacterized protein n=1 Tax=Oryza barthii TaxID=65489 RepID=A0A0D3ENQ6_9ORYZ
MAVTGEEDSSTDRREGDGGAEGPRTLAACCLRCRLRLPLTARRLRRRPHAGSLLVALPYSSPVIASPRAQPPTADLRPRVALEAACAPILPRGSGSTGGGASRTPLWPSAQVDREREAAELGGEGDWRRRPSAVMDDDNDRLQRA